MSPPPKADFLKECMSDPALVQGSVPIDEFNRAYCIRCIQKDCARAGLNGSLLARRAATWKENLFDKPPRAADGDPRYDTIRSKKFVQLAKDVVEMRTGAVNYEVQTQDLPAALRRQDPEPAQPPAPPPTAEPPPPPPPPVSALTPEPAAVEAPMRAVPAPSPRQNTPFEQGTVLPGGPSAAPAAPSEQVTEVGGSYVFGSEE